MALVFAKRIDSLGFATGGPGIADVGYVSRICVEQTLTTYILHMLYTDVPISGVAYRFVYYVNYNVSTGLFSTPVTVYSGASDQGIDLMRLADGTLIAGWNASVGGTIKESNDGGVTWGYQVATGTGNHFMGFIHDGT